MESPQAFFISILQMEEDLLDKKARVSHARAIADYVAVTIQF